MFQLRDALVVLTGAAGGIGRATARCFAAEGARLALCDVDAEGLDGVAIELRDSGAAVMARQVDVGQRHEVEAFAQHVVSTFGPPRVLVNNAGVGSMGLFHEMERETFERVVLTNLFGVVDHCRAFLPPMIASGLPGHIVNVASLAGLCPLPAASAYSAAKHAVVGFSRSLRPELAAHGIGVTVVCPGVIRTGIAQRARYEGRLAALRPVIIGDIARRGKSADLVARHILRAVHRNRPMVITPASARLLDRLQRHVPRVAAELARGYMAYLRWALRRRGPLAAGEGTDPSVEPQAAPPPRGDEARDGAAWRPPSTPSDRAIVT